ncbi:TRAPPC4, partial [Cordylochernes scorpioides]
MPNIIGIYIVSKAGSLIYDYENAAYSQSNEVEKTFSYPLDLILAIQNKRVTVVYGKKGTIKIGHVVLAVNGAPVQGTQMEDGAEVMEYLKESTNFPVSLKFGKPRLTSNDKIVLASMFHSLFAIASQLSPEPNSSGIELLEADTFKLYCFQTITGTQASYFFTQTPQSLR